MCSVPGCTMTVDPSRPCDWHRRNGTDPKLVAVPKPKPSQPRMARKPKDKQKPRLKPYKAARCEECESKSAVRSYRLDPRNLRPFHRLLCTPCQKRLGFTPVSYDRTMWTNTQTARRSEW